MIKKTKKDIIKDVSIQTLKGFRDFGPIDQYKRQWLIEKIKSVFELWGFDPIETPTLEPLELFAGQIGEDEKLFFKFKDQGGRDVALRYDQTVPASRFIAQNINNLPLPFKRYQIQSAFRAEKPQKGRYREFLQCDADIFGSSSWEADAETMALSLDIYRKIGFKKAILLLNDRELLKEIPYKAIVAIDKLNKIGEEEVVKEMIGKGIDQDSAKKYIDVVKTAKPNETINNILKYLEDYGFEKDWFRFEPTLARSFSYSTGPIWEVVIPEYASGSVLGGERYDNLVEKISGIKMPATGFAVGFDRTLEAAGQLGLIHSKKTSAKVLVTIFPALKDKSIEISSQLRSNNINCELYTEENAKLEKQLKYADKKGIPYVVIIGPNEAEKNVVLLRNMQTREQKTLNAEELIKGFYSPSICCSFCLKNDLFRA